jgi:hypothetical protein
MPLDAEFATTMQEAVALLNKVAVFYAKYHILPVEERHALALRLKHTQTEWARCAGFEQQHVDLITALLQQLRAHYHEWIQDDLVARKRWLRHPGESLNRLMLQSTNTIAMIQGSMANQSRKLSALEAKDAWPS